MRKEKVLLITPPYHCGVLESAGVWLPLGFVYLAGSLESLPVEVEIYDAMSKFHTIKDIEKKIEEEKPFLVATTAYTSTFPAALEVLKTAKRINPQTFTVIGGVHSTFMWEEALSNEEVDFVIRGEGEETFKELVESLLEGGDISKTKGIAYRDQGGIVATSPRPRIADLDTLTLAWDLVEWPIYKYYASDNKRLAIVSTSRGCIQGCTFCSQQLFWEKTWRARKPEKVIDELKLLREKYGVEVVMFSDEYPTADRVRWEKLLDLLIQEQMGLELLIETRVDDIIRDEDIMDKYREAGISHIYVGAESASQEKLETFKKNLSVKLSKKAIDAINKAEIISETSFVLGMPDETEESINKTIEVAKYYNADMTFFLAIAPWPYSEIYPELEDYIVTKDYSLYNFMNPVVKPKEMTLEQVREALNRAHFEFYMYKMKQISTMPAFKRKYMKDVFRILRDNSCIGDLLKKIKLPEAMKVAMRA